MLAQSSVVLPIIIGVVVLLVGSGAFVVSSRSKRGELAPPTTPKAVTTTDRPTELLPSEVAPAEADVDSDVEGDVEAPPSLSEELDALEGIEAAETAADTAVEKATFRNRLSRARGALSGALGSIRGRSAIDDETWDDLEEALIRADVGVGPTTELLDSVRATVKQNGITTPDELIDAVKAEMTTRLLAPIDLRESANKPSIWLFVGVNGVGKTTTIGKVGKLLTDDGRKVLMAAGDTFRAAAAEQLGTWAERCGADLVRGAEGSDPSSVIFDGIARGAATGADVVLADTAGRLHTKSNLMDELRKVRRVADKGEGEVTEVLLVLDATTGQNGLIQARQFTDAVELTGVVLTKLDGSAKGGIVFAIQSELGIPVKLVGLGEQAEDLIPFDAEQFVDALFATDEP
ncbi:MAG TPA: signal recognition particle-docking protein FtsY [Microthrixaceae bacterium]|nr:signal recognition particle-docking protein FtsY [Microthrixaceae bacterium]